MNKKGLIESGVIVTLVGILSTVGAVGVLYGPGNVISSGFVSVASVMTAYSQMPHVKRDFRENKALGYCKVTNNDNFCNEYVGQMNDDELLSYIRDDEVVSKPLNYGYNYKNDVPEYEEVGDMRLAGQ
mgnify:CR=1 FL=1